MRQLHNQQQNEYLLIPDHVDLPTRTKKITIKNNNGTHHLPHLQQENETAIQILHQKTTHAENENQVHMTFRILHFLFKPFTRMESTVPLPIVKH